MPGQVAVRWFAVAGEAAGRPDEMMVVDGTTTTADLLATAAAAHGPELARVLAACSVLVDGELDADRDHVLAAGATVDVLPPFAGG